MLLTPDLSQYILIPPKETVKKTLCLCSPLERAEEAIPCRRLKGKQHEEMKGYELSMKESEPFFLPAQV